MAKGFYIKTDAGKQQRVPAVTTILNNLGWNKGALIGWAHKQGLEGVTNLYEKLNKAAQAGTCAHAMIEALLKGKPFKPGNYTAEAIKAAQTAANAFLDWFKNQALIRQQSEFEAVSCNFRYGCRIDHIMIGSNGEIWVFSLKTGKGIYADAIIQAAAELNAYEEQERKKAAGIIIIAINRDTGDYEAEIFNASDPIITDAFNAFIHCRALHDLKTTIKVNK